MQDGGLSLGMELYAELPPHPAVQRIGLISMFVEIEMSSFSTVERAFGFLTAAPDGLRVGQLIFARTRPTHLWGSPSMDRGGFAIVGYVRAVRRRFAIVQVDVDYVDVGKCSNEFLPEHELHSSLEAAYDFHTGDHIKLLAWDLAPLPPKSVTLIDSRHVFHGTVESYENTFECQFYESMGRANSGTLLVSVTSDTSGLYPLGFLWSFNPLSARAIILPCRALFDSESIFKLDGIVLRQPTRGLIHS